MQVSAHNKISKFLKIRYLSELKKITTMVHHGSKNFEISSNETLLVSGLIENLDSADFSTTMQQYRIGTLDNSTLKVSKHNFYKEFEHRGYYFSGNLKQIHEIHVHPDGYIVAFVNDKIKDSDKIAYNLIESALQLIVFCEGEKMQSVNMVYFIQELSIDIEIIENYEKMFILEYNSVSKMLTAQGLLIRGAKLKPIVNNHVDTNLLLDEKIFVEFAQSFSFDTTLTKKVYKKLVV